MGTWPFCKHPSSQEFGVADREPQEEQISLMFKDCTLPDPATCPLLFTAHKIVKVQLSPQTMSYPFVGRMGLAQPEKGSFQGDHPRVLGTWGEFVNSFTLTLHGSTHIHCSCPLWSLST